MRRVQRRRRRASRRRRAAKYFSRSAAAARETSARGSGRRAPSRSPPGCRRWRGSRSARGRTSPPRRAPSRCVSGSSPVAQGTLQIRIGRPRAGATSSGTIATTTALNLIDLAPEVGFRHRQRVHDPAPLVRRGSVVLEEVVEVQKRLGSRARRPAAPADRPARRAGRCRRTRRCARARDRAADAQRAVGQAEALGIETHGTSRRPALLERSAPVDGDRRIRPSAAPAARRTASDGSLRASSATACAPCRARRAGRAP